MLDDGGGVEADSSAALTMRLSKATRGQRQRTVWAERLEGLWGAEFFGVLRLRLSR
jgi:hypothetical protein